MISKIRNLFSRFIIFALIAVGISLFGCGDGFNILLPDENILNPGYRTNDTISISAFNFITSENAVLSTDAIGDVDDSTVNVTVPFGTDTTFLVPDIAISGESVSPPDGLARTFVDGQGTIYTVTAADGSTRDYTVTVNIGSNPEAKDILTFKFLDSENGALSADVIGTVNANSITMTVPNGTVVTALVPDISISGQSVNPADGSATDFTTPATYTVTAPDTTTKDYTVTVNIAAIDAKDILSFDFLAVENAALSADIIGTVGVNTVNMTVPNGTDVSALIPDVKISGQSVSPVDGLANDFSGPVTYTVTAGDASTKDYTITVNVSAIDAKDILSFDFLATENPTLSVDVIGTVGASTVEATVPFGTNISALIPNITISGTSIDPLDGELQAFVDGVGSSYTVTAADSSTHVYSVTVNVAENDANDILTFNLLAVDNAALSADAIGTVGAGTVDLYVPYETTLSALVPDITISGISISPGDGVTHTFVDGAGETYTVTAADTTTQDYTVTVNVAANTATDILTFNFLAVENAALSSDVNGVVGAGTVDIDVPFGTTLSALVPDITMSGVLINPGDGVAHAFVDGVGETYTVTAADLVTTENHTVTVNVGSRAILRPNGNGDEANATRVGSSTNWQAVDDVSSDGDTTMVTSNQTGTWYRDLYEITDLGSVTTINKITVYILTDASRILLNNYGHARVAIKTDGSVYQGSEIDLPNGWTTFTKEWKTNPKTGSAWTWGEIDDLQIGVSLKSQWVLTGWGTGRCTRVYVAVDYIP